MTLDDLKAIEARERSAYEELAKIRAELIEAKSIDPANTIKMLVPLCREMMTIIRFAVANLPPSEIRGWPFEAVHTVANRLGELPDKTSDDLTFAIELRAFANEVVEAGKQHAASRVDREALRLKKARIVMLQTEANKAMLEGFLSEAKAKLLEIASLG